MTTKFPVALDSFPTINGTDLLTSPQHSAQHNNVADAVSALEAKVGVNGSTVTTSLTYQVSQKAGINHTHTGVYAASSHGHTIADVTGVQAGLDARYTKAEVDALLAANGGNPVVHKISLSGQAPIPVGGFTSIGPLTIAGLGADDGLAIRGSWATGVLASVNYNTPTDVYAILHNPGSFSFNPGPFFIYITVFKK